MSHGPQNELRGLMGRALEGGGLRKDEVARLAELCGKDDGVARGFGGQMEVDRLLEIALRNRAGGGGFSRSVMDRIGNEQEQRGVPFVSSVMDRVERNHARRGRGWVAAGIGLAAAVVIWLGITISGHGAARLFRDDSAKWSSPPVGESLKAGTRLRLDSGLAEIHFSNGAEVILEGPADFEVRGRSKGFVRLGRVSVRVPERAVGFTLESPGGKVVDLGTAFGIHVDEDGGTEAEVFEGKIQVRPNGGDKDMILERDEKFVSSGDVWTKSRGIDANSFVTSLPPQSVGIPDFVHWPFNEGAGGTAAASGRFRTAPQPAELRNFGETAGAMPRWIDGPYGRALSFDGAGDALETHYPGVVGDAARTVAFWLRLPENFDPEQGYGIVSWGDLAEQGNAWQISVNPYAHEGPVGRLRVGVFPSLVTGSTDLRDGRWHHCAVVLYKDERNLRRVPILLYVDGRMEATAAKGVMGRIHTSSLESSRPVWIAKSLRHDEPGRSRGTGFFRGDLDEVYIFDGALNQRQIENLMQFNTLFPESY